MDLYLSEKLRPKVIGKRLNIHPYVVYDAVDSFKKKLKKLLQKIDAGVLSMDRLPTKNIKKKTDELQVQEALRFYLLEHGTKDLTLGRVKLYMDSLLQDGKTVSRKQISFMLRKRYHLNLKRLNPADFRYKDPYYNEKRLWVSRLLAQFLLDGALLVSVDESNFRMDAFKKYSW
jgi:hypothetical protein